MLRGRVDHVRLSIAQFAAKVSRIASDIRLIAVSKTFGPELIRHAYQIGLRDFGENYVDELIQKAEELKDLPDIHWVFIGQLQSNKIQKIVRVASEIQSVATEKHARYIERYVLEHGKSQFPVWIVVNAGNESTKQGVSPEDTPHLANFITKQCPHLSLQGIMAIPPAEFSDKNSGTPEGVLVPEVYKKLRELADQTGLGKLSLGMSNDLQLAITAGSDCVRIGSAIFGQRA